VSHRPSALLIGLAVGAAALVVLVPLGATAQEEESTECAERRTIVEMLNSQYDETARAIGVISEEVVLEVFVSKESGTWTVLVTDPQGLSCVLAAGQAWQETPQATDQPEPNGDGGHGALVKLSPSPPL
jgi:hypothetical protein